MARTRKAAANGDGEPSQPMIKEKEKDTEVESTTSRSSTSALLAPSSTTEREEVKVNNASITELKHACDDALKRVSRPASPLFVLLFPFGTFFLP